MKTIGIGRRRGALVAAVSVTTLGLAAGIAYATIPGPGNVYSACMLKGLGTIRLIDKSLPSTTLLSRCTDKETEISWNQAGQPGPMGPAGPKGEDGDDGSGLARLEDLNGLPCSSSSFGGRAGRVSVETADESIRSASIELRCRNTDARTLSIRVVRADLASEAAELSGVVRIDDDTGRVCPLDDQCEFDVLTGTELTVRAQPTSEGTAFVEWRSAPCAGSTDPACTFRVEDNFELVAAFGIRSG